MYSARREGRELGQLREAACLMYEARRGEERCTSVWSDARRSHLPHQPTNFRVRCDTVVALRGPGPRRVRGQRRGIGRGVGCRGLLAKWVCSAFVRCRGRVMG
jgi:hypothetical protein